MTNPDKHLLIPKIRNGIVIDHVPVGLGPRVLDMIRSYPEMGEIVITLGVNYLSSKLGRKDLVKLDVRELPQSLLHEISLISPGVSIKRITNYEVDKKYVNQPPERILNLARCRNPNCVTNSERGMKTSFRRLSESSMQFRCDFCERVFDLDELEIIRTPGR